MSKCTGCGVCAGRCPVEAIDTYNLGMMSRPAIYVDYQQVVPLIYTINRDVCIGCGFCAEYCEAGAIDYEQEPSKRKIEVGSMIVSAGSDVFDAGLKGEYGHGRFRNVVSSLEFERILSASGPFRGMVLRPSDGEEPQRIAFLQCVGMRDAKTGNNYCSTACCMWAVKEAVIAKEHVHDLDITIFFMDMRSFGKTFDEYVDRAENKSGVNFVRTRVSHVDEIPGSRNLRISYETEEGDFMVEEFDMVVLSTGLTSSPYARQLADKLGIELNEFGFVRTGEFQPIHTSRSGIYVRGPFQEPKYIPETVMQSSAAAAFASSVIAEERGSLIEKVGFPESVDVMGLGPRIGVFVCHCGINIAGYVAIEEIENYAKSLPDVIYTTRNLFTCSQDTQEKMKELIREHDLNRVVVASCTPRTHEPLFQETLEAAGLNRYLFEMANIRDQCSWVHMNQPEEGTEKAKELIRMAVAKVRLASPLERLTFDVTKRALVIGGGLAGLTAARGISRQGFPVTVVEKEDEPGGNFRNLRFTLSGEDPRNALEDLLAEVDADENIDIRTSSRVKGVDGFVGNFITTLETPEGEVKVEHGVTIIATGGQEYRPTEYLYGEDDRVITQTALEGRLADGEDFGKGASYVMIGCVGSRNDENPWCSRYCCTKAILNALEIKERDHEATVYYVYQDIRTYGFRETLYEKARKKGVIFIRYDREKEPKAALENGSLVVQVEEKLLQEEIQIGADYLVLGTAILPNADSEAIANLYRLPMTEHKFFLEAHMKLRPVDFAADGIYMCGLCHFPKFSSESIAQANAAVGRALTVLSKDKIEAEGKISFVTKEHCSACGACEAVCPYGAVEVIEEETRWGVERYARVTAALCKGCGVCASTCRAGAININGFTDDQIFEMIEAF